MILTLESTCWAYGCSLYHFPIYLEIFIIKYWGKKTLFFCSVLHSHRSHIFGKLPICITMQLIAKISFSYKILIYLCEVPGINFFPLPSIQRFPKRNDVFTSSNDTRLFETSYFPPRGTHIHRTRTWPEKMKSSTYFYFTFMLMLAGSRTVPNEPDTWQDHQLKESCYAVGLDYC